MAVTIGNTLLKKLVAEESGVDVRDVNKVFAARAKVIKGLLDTGAKVRVDDIGFVQQTTTKATRRRSPHDQKIVEVPARTKVVFKEIRKTSNDDTL